MEIYMDDDGRMKVKDAVFFVVVQDERLISKTCRRRLKDTCLAFEDLTGIPWEDAARRGAKVFKLFSNGHDKTQESLASISEWMIEL